MAISLAKRTDRTAGVSLAKPSDRRPAGVSLAKPSDDALPTVWVEQIV